MAKTKTDAAPAADSAKDGRSKAINAALEQITKQFGEGSIMKMADQEVKKVDIIPTGAISLDIALGVGGVPKGRIVEIYGPESSGKTSLTLHIAAEAQKQGGVVAFIDAEHAFDPNYAQKIGVNLENLLISQPDYGEQALEILETLVRSGAVDLIIVDSVAALTPKAEIEGEMGDSHMGLQARLMSQALRKITGIVGKTGTTVIFINQLRMKIGVMFGNPETTTGGNALKFYSSVRMDIRRTEKISSGDELLGHVVRVKVVKNKMAPPFREALFDMINGKGIDGMSSLIDAALKFGVIEKAGSWFKYNGENLGQGKDGVKELLSSDPKLAAAVTKLVQEKAGLA
ncbi:recombinase RecA [Candidatus Dojkabacteria bacterium]|uniref:Protein RecA n=1 Tax=Candidatus Dojkabacteria bacterium TaxID=2099670 RepID=A0A955I950_9BACT|nr:recombinase RecA [Candidatus Dojkabacteria bacterium]